MLVGVTIVSVYTAETVPWRIGAVAAIMAIAAFKAVVILRRFMDLAAAPTGVRVYMTGWAVGAAAMICGAFWYAP